MAWSVRKKTEWRTIDEDLVTILGGIKGSVERKLEERGALYITTGPKDMVLRSNKLRKVYLIELTIPWWSCIQEARKRKRLKYTDLASEMGNKGWDTKIYPVEVGCRSFGATSTTTLQRYLGINGWALR